MDSEVFAQLPPSKLILRCAIPSMITMAFGALYSVADGLFVGRFVGQDALAAINLIMPVIMIVFAFSNMIATGSSVHISILLGEKKQEEASRVFFFSVQVILILSCALGLFGYCFAQPLIRLLSPGATEQAIQYSVQYLRVYAAFAPLRNPHDHPCRNDEMVTPCRDLIVSARKAISSADADNRLAMRYSNMSPSYSEIGGSWKVCTPIIPWQSISL